MKTSEILREGEWTRDGRLIRPGGVYWDDDVIDVMEFIDETVPPIIIGSLWNIRREGDYILADTDVMGLVTVTVKDLVVERVVAHGAPGEKGVIIESCVIQTGFVTEPGTYPW